jgi:hypothetical protein
MSELAIPFFIPRPRICTASEQPLMRTREIYGFILPDCSSLAKFFRLSNTNQETILPASLTPPSLGC